MSRWANAQKSLRSSPLRRALDRWVGNQLREEQ